MTKRVPRPNFETRFSVAIPEGTDPAVREFIEQALREAEALAAKPTVRAPKVRLRNRNTRKAGKWPCTQTATIGGKTIVGCGRTFGSEANRDRHMDLVKGIWSDTSRWPNGCLDAIVPENLRDDR